MIAALLSVLPVALIAMFLYDVLGLRAVQRWIDALPDVSEDDRATAMLCMDQARARDWRTRLYDLSAPIVMACVIPFVPRSANQLPRLFRRWDNNISLNGDSGGVQMPDGRWIGYHDVERLVLGGWEAVKDCLQVTYDDPRYNGDCYYAKGHHPRSRWARYVWVGLRNRATKLALDLGAEVDKPIELISGSLDIGTGKGGHFLLKCGDIYHFKSAERFKLFGFDLCCIRSYGFKLEIALKSPDQAKRVAVVAIGWSAKTWKGQA